MVFGSSVSDGFHYAWNLTNVGMKSGFNGMPTTDNLVVSIGLIEKDFNGDVLWTWAYPTVSEAQRNVALRKCGISQGTVNDDLHNQQQHQAQSFVYCHYRKLWLYVTATDVFETDQLNKVKQFGLVLWTWDFNPEKYERLCRILSKTFCKTGSAAAIVSLYLSVLTHGSCITNENGIFIVADFDQRKAFANVNIKAVIKAFKLEVIFLYTALILKKRIAVYHHRLDALLAFMRVLPSFVWHRQNWDILYPYVELNVDEIDDLRSNVTYASGFVDASIEGRSDLYDVFINLAATEISVAGHAKEAFAMSKIHKDIALSMMRCAENDDISEHQTIREIADKTKELLNQLCLCASGDNKNNSMVVDFNCQIIQLDLARLKERKLSPALENFLINLAVAENISFV